MGDLTGTEGLRGDMGRLPGAVRSGLRMGDDLTGAASACLRAQAFSVHGISINSCLFQISKRSLFRSLVLRQMDSFIRLQSLKEVLQTYSSCRLRIELRCSPAAA